MVTTRERATQDGVARLCRHRPLENTGQASQPCGEEAARMTRRIRLSANQPLQARRAAVPLSVTVPLAVACADTLTQAALAGLRRIYRTGFAYQKAG